MDMRCNSESKGARLLSVCLFVCLFVGAVTGMCYHSIIFMVTELAHTQHRATKSRRYTNSMWCPRQPRQLPCTESQKMEGSTL
ncbi:hypothetical protein J3F83DRAFT_82196 [Trichoderma novae-zelandiae]